MLFCVDIGVPRSSIGMKQYRRILHSQKCRNMPIHPSNRTFRFGNQTVSSVGIIKLALRAPGNIQPIPVLLAIVSVNIPASLGPDISDGYSLLADNVKNRL